ncbi:MAG: methyltransferase domain-containing protein [Bacteroidetes bacterium]|nr:methyltransferase domain-containing protein [Bacteroidota bacterium]HET6244554.1 methyltransferase domain-containing protein [Bacteroidia bacterium]
MMGFSNRSRLPELMDNPYVPDADVRIALVEIEFINRYLGGNNLLVNALSKVGFTNGTTLMDLGCGSGDMLRIISNFALKNKLSSYKLFGVDINPSMTSFAESRSKAFPEIEFINIDIWDEKLFGFKPDIIINSLFCHHFDDDQLVLLIKRMYNLCGKVIIINDLHRHWFAYYAIKCLTFLFSKSYLVKYDGPLSVARALTKAEWMKLLFRAEVYNYQINWKWAWRWQIIIHKK